MQLLISIYTHKQYAHNIVYIYIYITLETMIKYYIDAFTN